MEGTAHHAGYRQLCLQLNDIHILNPSIPLPATIKIHRTQFTQIVSKMPQLPSDTVASAIRELEELGLQSTENDVADFWRKYIFPKSSESLLAGLTTKAGIHMARHLLPKLPTAPFPVQQPRPDLLYGYSFEAFTRIQLGMLISLYPEAPFGLLLPFLVVEYKAAGGCHECHDGEYRHNVARYRRRMFPLVLGKLDYPQHHGAVQNHPDGEDELHKG